MRLRINGGTNSSIEFLGRESIINEGWFLKLPDGGRPILVRGKIIWSKHLGGNTYRFGVSLENLDLTCLARAFKIKFA